MRFKLTIFVKGAQARWFDLPVFEKNIPLMRDIKERVFVDEQYFGNHKETMMEGLENLNIGDHETNTEGVEILNIVPDDWEDSLITTEGEEFTQEHLYLSDKEKDRTKPNLYDCPRCGLESMTYGDLRDHLDNVHSQDINVRKLLTLVRSNVNDNTKYI
jgi:hypothetical protein